MIRKLRKEEAGYSLVEVIVSIFILSIAIIPMVAMFDSGLRAATLGGNYDTARTLANQNLEQVRAMDFGDVEALNSCPADREGFDCVISTAYVALDDTNPLVQEFRVSEDVEDMIRVTVTVEWGVNNDFSTSGLIAR